MRLWTSETWREYKDEKRWAKLRVRRDEASAEDYFDILVGKTGQEHHAHIGIALDQTLLFAEYRNVVRKLGRKIESQQKGLIEDNETIINPGIKPGKDLKFQITLNPSTGEIKVLDFGLIEEEEKEVDDSL